MIEEGGEGSDDAVPLETWLNQHHALVDRFESPNMLSSVFIFRTGGGLPPRFGAQR